MKKRIPVALASALLVAGVVFFPLIFPSTLFAYSVSVGNLSIYSDEPIDKNSGAAVLNDISERLAASPLGGREKQLNLYVANSRWRQRWLWIVPNSNAGGFVVIPLTRNHAFLSGANFKNNQLVGPSGYEPLPPRTLSYFGAHELTHAIQGLTQGAIRYYLTPSWVTEGLADYAALPRETAQELYSQIGEANADLDMMKAHGVYAPYRLLVTFFLVDENWSIEDLLATKLGIDEARGRAFPALRVER